MHICQADTIRSKPFTSVEVTLYSEAIHSLLNTLRAAKDHKLASTYPAAASLAQIKDKWGVGMSVFSPPPTGYSDKRTFRLNGDASTQDLRLLAMLGIVSEATSGQGEHIGPQINLAVEQRSTTGCNSNREMDWEMTEGDLFYVLRDLAKQVKVKVKVCFALHFMGNVVADLWKNHDEEDLARKRKADYDGRRKKLSKDRKDAEQADDTGLNFGIQDKDMQRLGKKMKKAAVKDAVTMAEEDSEEEEKPDERMVL
jgi:hypothetical protein